MRLKRRRLAFLPILVLPLMTPAVMAVARVMVSSPLAPVMVSMSLAVSELADMLVSVRVSVPEPSW